MRKAKFILITIAIVVLSAMAVGCRYDYHDGGRDSGYYGHGGGYRDHDSGHGHGGYRYRGGYCD